MKYIRPLLFINTLRPIIYFLRIFYTDRIRIYSFFNRFRGMLVCDSFDVVARSPNLEEYDYS